MNVIYRAMDDFERIRIRFIRHRIAWTSGNMRLYLIAEEIWYIYMWWKIGGAVKGPRKGSEEAVKHGITHPLHAPSFPRGGNATSYFSRRERMEMEAEMNATVTVVLGSPRSFAFLISATVFFFVRFFSRPYIRIPFFFFHRPSRVADSRKGKAEKRRRDKREKDICANALGLGS